MFAGQGDSVLSEHIKEADGVTGQDTNSGSGVKTGHIQDGAVTDAKITGPISASKISSAGLDADTVDGAHASDLAPSVHTHTQSAIEGLTDALAGKADVAQNHDAVYQKKYGGVAVVAKSGGDYTDPVSAMNDKTSWCGTPSSGNPCLVKIMPGVYDIGTNYVAMQSYIDIEGSGESVTVIQGDSIEGTSKWWVVQMADDSEIRNLTIKNYGGGKGIGIIYSGAGTKVTNVTVEAFGGVEHYAIFIQHSSYVTLDNVTAIASGGSYAVGIYIHGDAVNGSAFNNVTAIGSSEIHGIGMRLQALKISINDFLAEGTGSTRGEGISTDSGHIYLAHGSSTGSTRGISNEGYPPLNFMMKMVNVEATGGESGIRNAGVGGNVVEIHRSLISGGTYGIFNGYEFTTNIALSQVDGPIYGALNCYSVYDSNFGVICP